MVSDAGEHTATCSKNKNKKKISFAGFRGIFSQFSAGYNVPPVDGGKYLSL